jgi:hypothetical protein
MREDAKGFRVLHEGMALVGQTTPESSRHDRRASTNPRGKQAMKKLISTLMSAAILTASLALLPSPASAKTATQIKNEQKGAAAKAKSKAKSDAKKHK